MSQLTDLIDELVTANRILASENVVDAFGHISVRHPDKPGHYFLSRARAPQCIEADDIMEFTLDGTPVNGDGRSPYRERFIHGALFEARPDVHSVVHNHSLSVIPFGITGRKLRPVMHMTASMGGELPVWDIQTKFGDTDLLVSDFAMGQDLAKTVGQGSAALMRGHGCVVAKRGIREAVQASIYLEINAGLQMRAEDMGSIHFLSDGEIGKISGKSTAAGSDRAWEYWCYRAGVPFKSGGGTT